MFRSASSLALLAIAAMGLSQDVKVEKYVLPNGMKVILHVDKSLPLATINTWYGVGSKDEPDRRSGFAHLFEHLMFMGTARVPGNQFDVLMESAGGGNNASTAEDRTNYYSTGPANLLPTLLWLDADRLEALSQTMTQEKLDLQREVVRNERRQNTENTPYGKAYNSINELMFPKGHPYSWSVIGSHEDLQSASVEDVKSFFDTYYVPNNASLVVAGDFDPAEIKPLIAQWFGTLPRRDDVPRRPVPPIDFKPKQVTVVDQVQFAKIINVWHSPAAYKPGDVEMRLASAVLSNGLTSRLYDRIVVKDELATEVQTFQEPRLLGSLFYVDATLAPGKSLDQLQSAIDDELRRFANSGPTAAELGRQKSQVEFGLLSSLQSLGGKADQLNEYEFYFGEPNSFAKVLGMYRSASPASVRNAAANTLKLDKRLVLRVIPRMQESEQNPRDGAPELLAESPFTPQAPSEFTLSNGIKVQYWHRPQLPLMSLAASFGVGADSDPADKAGRAELTADMLDEGAGTRSAQQFQDALDQLGASFGAGAGYRSSSVSMSVIESNFSKALDLVADALARPTFSPPDWQRVQRTTVAALEQDLDDPSTVARQVAMREFFGSEHPYGRPVGGTPKTVASLSLADIKDAYGTVYKPANTTLFVAGSLPEAELRTELERTLGTWTSTAPAAATTAYPELTVKPLRVVVVDRPDSVQTVIRFVLPGVPYNDERRQRFAAIGTILGGSFTSRLNQNLREAKGYTYGAGSSFAFEPALGWLVASSSVRADVTGASIDEFLKELKAIRAGNITPEEAGKARSTQRAAVVESMESLGSILATAIGLHLQGKPFSHLGTELAAIAALDADDLNAVVTQAVDLDHGVLVLVGDKNAILTQLEGKGLPTPEIVSAGGL